MTVEQNNNAGAESPARVGYVPDPSMNVYGKAKMKVAIGVAGGGVVLEVLETNDLLDRDVKDLGNYIEDMFHGGPDVPTKAGIYIFDGITECPFTNEWYHQGVFNPVT